MRWIVVRIIAISVFLVGYAYWAQGFVAKGLRAKLFTLLGLILMFSSVFLPWVDHGGPERFVSNMDYIATALRLGDFADWAPRLPILLGVSGSDLDSGEKLINALSQKESGFICEVFLHSNSISGWMAGQYASNVDSSLNIFVSILAMGTGILLLANLSLTYWLNETINLYVGRVTGAFALLTLLSGRKPASYYVSYGYIALFQQPPTEPDLQVSKYPALQ